MRERIGAALVAVGVALAFTACQSASTTTSPPVARTPWGDPDVQGLWSQKYQIPLQRAARDADKPTLTDEEVKQREADRQRQADTAPRRGDRVAQRGTLEDLTGAYDTTFEAEIGRAHV